MAQSEAKPALATTTVFNQGKFPSICKKVETSSGGSPPKPLLIVTPTTSGQYPVILFLHGFLLRYGFYSQLLEHISSHGFIVVAPQLYESNILTAPSVSGPEEIESAARVTNWLSIGLQPQLPENVEANLQKLALAGHSRGGQAAFALALGHAKTSLKFSVLLGIDPVAGNKDWQPEPHILTKVPRSFNISIPVTVIGTGLGPKKKIWGLVPACAPEGFNHKQYFNECKTPCAHFVTKDYGHLDMLNDNLSDVLGYIMRNFLCENGKGPREPMRRSVGGIVVAFLRAYLEGENGVLVAILSDPNLRPVKLEPAKLIEA